MVEQTTLQNILTCVIAVIIFIFQSLNCIIAWVKQHVKHKEKSTTVGTEDTVISNSKPNDNNTSESFIRTQELIQKHFDIPLIVAENDPKVDDLIKNTELLDSNITSKDVYDQFMDNLIDDSYVARGLGLITATVGQEAEFYLYSKYNNDFEGIVIELKERNGEISQITILNRNSVSPIEPKSIPIEYIYDEDRVKVIYTLFTEGVHTLTLTRNNIPICRSPYYISVEKGPVNSRSRIRLGTKKYRMVTKFGKGKHTPIEIKDNVVPITESNKSTMKSNVRSVTEENPVRTDVMSIITKFESKNNGMKTKVQKHKTNITEKSLKNNMIQETTTSSDKQPKIETLPKKLNIHDNFLNMGKMSSKFIITNTKCSNTVDINQERNRQVDTIDDNNYEEENKCVTKLDENVKISNVTLQKENVSIPHLKTIYSDDELVDKTDKRESSRVEKHNGTSSINELLEEPNNKTASTNLDETRSKIKSISNEGSVQNDVSYYEHGNKYPTDLIKNTNELESSSIDHTVQQIADPTQYNINTPSTSIITKITNNLCDKCLKQAIEMLSELPRDINIKYNKNTNEGHLNIETLLAQPIRININIDNIFKNGINENINEHGPNIQTNNSKKIEPSDVINDDNIMTCNRLSEKESSENYFKELNVNNVNIESEIEQNVHYNGVNKIFNKNISNNTTIPLTEHNVEIDKEVQQGDLLSGDETTLQKCSTNESQEPINSNIINVNNNDRQENEIELQIQDTQKFREQKIEIIKSSDCDINEKLNHFSEKFTVTLETNNSLIMNGDKNTNETMDEDELKLIINQEVNTEENSDFQSSTTNDTVTAPIEVLLTNEKCPELDDKQQGGIICKTNNQNVENIITRDTRYKLMIEKSIEPILNNFKNDMVERILQLYLNKDFSNDNHTEIIENSTNDSNEIKYLNHTENTECNIEKKMMNDEIQIAQENNKKETSENILCEEKIDDDNLLKHVEKIIEKNMTSNTTGTLAETKLEEVVNKAMQHQNTSQINASDNDTNSEQIISTTDTSPQTLGQDFINTSIEEGLKYETLKQDKDGQVGKEEENLLNEKPHILSADNVSESQIVNKTENITLNSQIIENTENKQETPLTATETISEKNTDAVIERETIHEPLDKPETIPIEECNVKAESTVQISSFLENLTELTTTSKATISNNSEEKTLKTVNLEIIDNTVENVTSNNTENLIENLNESDDDITCKVQSSENAENVIKNDQSTLQIETLIEILDDPNNLKSVNTKEDSNTIEILNSEESENTEKNKQLNMNILTNYTGSTVEEIPPTIDLKNTTILNVITSKEEKLNETGLKTQSDIYEPCDEGNIKTNTFEIAENIKELDTGCQIQKLNDTETKNKNNTCTTEIDKKSIKKLKEKKSFEDVQNLVGVVSIEYDPKSNEFATSVQAKPNIELSEKKSTKEASKLNMINITVVAKSKTIDIQITTMPKITNKNNNERTENEEHEYIDVDAKSDKLTSFATENKTRQKENNLEMNTQSDTLVNQTSIIKIRSKLETPEVDGVQTIIPMEIHQNETENQLKSEALDLNNDELNSETNIDTKVATNILILMDEQNMTKLESQGLKTEVNISNCEELPIVSIENEKVIEEDTPFVSTPSKNVHISSTEEITQIQIENTPQNSEGDLEIVNTDTSKMTNIIIPGSNSDGELSSEDTVNLAITSIRDVDQNEIKNEPDINMLDRETLIINSPDQIDTVTVIDNQDPQFEQSSPFQETIKPEKHQSSGLLAISSKNEIRPVNQSLKVEIEPLSIDLNSKDSLTTSEKTAKEEEIVSFNHTVPDTEGISREEMIKKETETPTENEFIELKTVLVDSLKNIDTVLETNIQNEDTGTEDIIVELENPDSNLITDNNSLNIDLVDENLRNKIELESLTSKSKESTSTLNELKENENQAEAKLVDQETIFTNTSKQGNEKTGSENLELKNDQTVSTKNCIVPQKSALKMNVNITSDTILTENVKTLLVEETVHKEIDIDDCKSEDENKTAIEDLPKQPATLATNIIQVPSDTDVAVVTDQLVETTEPIALITDKPIQKPNEVEEKSLLVPKVSEDIQSILDQKKDENEIHNENILLDKATFKEDNLIIINAETSIDITKTQNNMIITDKSVESTTALAEENNISEGKNHSKIKLVDPETDLVEKLEQMKTQTITESQISVEEQNLTIKESVKPTSETLINSNESEIILQILNKDDPTLKNLNSIEFSDISDESKIEAEVNIPSTCTITNYEQTLSVETTLQNETAQKSENKNIGPEIIVENPLKSVLKPGTLEETELQNIPVENKLEVKINNSPTFIKTYDAQLLPAENIIQHETTPTPQQENETVDTEKMSLNHKIPDIENISKEETIQTKMSTENEVVESKTVVVNNPKYIDIELKTDINIEEPSESVKPVSVTLFGSNESEIISGPKSLKIENDITSMNLNSTETSNIPIEDKTNVKVNIPPSSIMINSEEALSIEKTSQNANASKSENEKIDSEIIIEEMLKNVLESTSMISDLTELSCIEVENKKEIDVESSAETLNTEIVTNNSKPEDKTLAEDPTIQIIQTSEATPIEIPLQIETNCTSLSLNFDKSTVPVEITKRETNSELTSTIAEDIQGVSTEETFKNKIEKSEVDELVTPETVVINTNSEMIKPQYEELVSTKETMHSEIPALDLVTRCNDSEKVPEEKHMEKTINCKTTTLNSQSLPIKSVEMTEQDIQIQLTPTVSEDINCLPSIETMKIPTEIPKNNELVKVKTNMENSSENIDPENEINIPTLQQKSNVSTKETIKSQKFVSDQRTICNTNIRLENENLKTEMELESVTFDTKESTTLFIKDTKRAKEETESDSKITDDVHTLFVEQTIQNTIVNPSENTHIDSSHLKEDVLKKDIISTLVIDLNPIELPDTEIKDKTDEQISAEIVLTENVQTSIVEETDHIEIEIDNARTENSDYMAEDSIQPAKQMTDIIPVCNDSVITQVAEPFTNETKNETKRVILISNIKESPDESAGTPKVLEEETSPVLKIIEDIPAISGQETNQNEIHTEDISVDTKIFEKNNSKAIDTKISFNVTKTQDDKITTTKTPAETTEELVKKINENENTVDLEINLVNPENVIIENSREINSQIVIEDQGSQDEQTLKSASETLINPNESAIIPEQEPLKMENNSTSINISSEESSGMPIEDKTTVKVNIPPTCSTNEGQTLSIEKTLQNETTTKNDKLYNNPEIVEEGPLKSCLKTETLISTNSSELPVEDKLEVEIEVFSSFTKTDDTQSSSVKETFPYKTESQQENVTVDSKSIIINTSEIDHTKLTTDIPKTEDVIIVSTEECNMAQEEMLLKIAKDPALLPLKSNESPTVLEKIFKNEKENTSLNLTTSEDTQCNSIEKTIGSETECLTENELVDIQSVITDTLEITNAEIETCIQSSNQIESLQLKNPMTSEPLISKTSDLVPANNILSIENVTEPLNSLTAEVVDVPVIENIELNIEPVSTQTTSDENTFSVKKTIHNEIKDNLEKELEDHEVYDIDTLKISCAEIDSNISVPQAIHISSTEIISEPAKIIVDDHSITSVSDLTSVKEQLKTETEFTAIIKESSSISILNTKELDEESSLTCVEFPNAENIPMKKSSHREIKEFIKNEKDKSKENVTDMIQNDDEIMISEDVAKPEIKVSNTISIFKSPDKAPVEDILKTETETLPSHSEEPLSKSTINLEEKEAEIPYTSIATKDEQKLSIEKIVQIKIEHEPENELANPVSDEINTSTNSYAEITVNNSQENYNPEATTEIPDSNFKQTLSTKESIEPNTQLIESISITSASDIFSITKILKTQEEPTSMTSGINKFQAINVNEDKEATNVSSVISENEKIVSTEETIQNKTEEESNNELDNHRIVIQEKSEECIEEINQRDTKNQQNIKNLHPETTIITTSTLEGTETEASIQQSPKKQALLTQETLDPEKQISESLQAFSDMPHLEQSLNIETEILPTTIISKESPVLSEITTKKEEEIISLSHRLPDIEDILKEETSHKETESPTKNELVESKTIVDYTKNIETKIITDIQNEETLESVKPVSETIINSNESEMILQQQTSNIENDAISNNLNSIESSNTLIEGKLEAEVNIPSDCLITNDEQTLSIEKTLQNETIQTLENENIDHKVLIEGPLKNVSNPVTSKLTKLQDMLIEDKLEIEIDGSSSFVKSDNTRSLSLKDKIQYKSDSLTENQAIDSKNTVINIPTNINSEVLIDIKKSENNITLMTGELIQPEKQDTDVLSVTNTSDIALLEETSLKTAIEPVLAPLDSDASLASSLETDQNEEEKITLVPTVFEESQDKPIEGIVEKESEHPNVNELVESENNFRETTEQSDEKTIINNQVLNIEHTESEKIIIEPKNQTSDSTLTCCESEIDSVKNALIPETELSLSSNFEKSQVTDEIKSDMEKEILSIALAMDNTQTSSVKEATQTATTPQLEHEQEIDPETVVEGNTITDTNIDEKTNISKSDGYTTLSMDESVQLKEQVTATSLISNVSVPTEVLLKTESETSNVTHTSTESPSESDTEKLEEKSVQNETIDSVNKPVLKKKRIICTSISSDTSSDVESDIRVLEDEQTASIIETIDSEKPVSITNSISSACEEPLFEISLKKETESLPVLKDIPVTQLKEENNKEIQDTSAQTIKSSDNLIENLVHEETENRSMISVSNDIDVVSINDIKSTSQENTLAISHDTVSVGAYESTSVDTKSIPFIDETSMKNQETNITSLQYSSESILPDVFHVFPSEEPFEYNQITSSEIPIQNTTVMLAETPFEIDKKFESDPSNSISEDKQSDIEIDTPSTTLVTDDTPSETQLPGDTLISPIAKLKKMEIETIIPILNKKYSITKKPSEIESKDDQISSLHGNFETKNSDTNSFFEHGETSKRILSRNENDSPEKSYGIQKLEMSVHRMKTSDDDYFEKTFVQLEQTEKISVEKNIVEDENNTAIDDKLYTVNESDLNAILCASSLQEALTLLDTKVKFKFKRNSRKSSNMVNSAVHKSNVLTPTSSSSNKNTNFTEARKFFKEMEKKSKK